jgi:hypothetical protein
LLIYFMAFWNILRTFGISYNHLVHFVFICYIFPVLVSCTNKNLATLNSTLPTTSMTHFFLERPVSISKSRSANEMLPVWVFVYGYAGQGDQMSL